VRPNHNGDCDYSAADLARQPFPGLGDFLLSYGNYGHSRSNAFQAEFKHRNSHGLLLNLAYTYLRQNSTGIDSGNSSLGGVAYDIFNPEVDYTRSVCTDQPLCRLRRVYDLPVVEVNPMVPRSQGGRCLLGGWHQFQQCLPRPNRIYAVWICDNCDPAVPGKSYVRWMRWEILCRPSFRPIVTGNPNKRSGDQLWDASAFALPAARSDLFSNGQIAKAKYADRSGHLGVIRYPQELCGHGAGQR